jgi:hypothetical protein
MRLSLIVFCVHVMYNLVSFIFRNGDILIWFVRWVPSTTWLSTSGTGRATLREEECPPYQPLISLSTRPNQIMLPSPLCLSVLPTRRNFGHKTQKWPYKVLTSRKNLLPIFSDFSKMALTFLKCVLYFKVLITVFAELDCYIHWFMEFFATSLL